MARRAARPAAVYRADAVAQVTARRGRLAAALLLALLAAPGTWLRTPLVTGPEATIRFNPVPFQPPHGWPEGLAVEGAWKIAGTHPFFGGYSALLLERNGRARAFSDLGEQLAFALPGHGQEATRMRPVPPHPAQARARQDIEAATADPATGDIWLAYEQDHAIRRLGEGGTGDRLARPDPMRGWSANSGAEALVRLTGGRFIALGERSGTGVLFAGDPVEGAAARTFQVRYPPGHRPVDAARLPGGRVLVLTRKAVPAWPPFASLLLIGDAKDIAPGKTWRPRVLARLNGPLPRENYEALAVAREGEGAVIWLLSDDNFASFQRTLLVKLRWREPDGT